MNGQETEKVKLEDLVILNLDGPKPNFLSDYIAWINHRDRNWQMQGAGVPLKEAKFWYKELSNCERTTNIWNDFILPSLSEKIINMDEFKVDRQYANAQTEGQRSSIHKDANTERTYTCLLYATESWALGEEGETLFYNDVNEIVAGVNPLPGRITVFKGSIAHVGRPLHRESKLPRITVAFKLLPKNPSEDKRVIYDNWNIY
jgi:hypothetical protein